MYAIVKTGGKQYRVQQGQSLLVERLPAAEGDSVALTPLLVVDGDNLADGEALSRATVGATVVAHERGPKLRVVKFKPKRGYKRRNGHRQELTRIQITEIKLPGAKRSTAKKKAEPTEEAAAKRQPSSEAGGRASQSERRAGSPAEETTNGA